MLATDQPLPFFDWSGLYAENAERYGAILRETAGKGSFILGEAVSGFERTGPDTSASGTRSRCRTAPTPCSSGCAPATSPRTTK